MIAEGLSRIAMSSGLAASLSRATDYARAQGHAEVALEHMLLALCDDPDAALVLAASNVNVAELIREVEDQLAALPTRAQGQESELVVASDLRRILEAAAAAARGGRRREINGAIVLAAIVGDGKSSAAQVLSRLGMTFEGAIRALQSKPAAELASPGAPAPDAEAILAGARERVQSRTGMPVRQLPAGHEITHGEPDHTHEEYAPPGPAYEPEPQALEAPPAREEQGYAPEPMHEPAFEHPPAEPDPYSPGLPGYEPSPYEPEAPPRPSSAPFPPPIPPPGGYETWAPPPSPPPRDTPMPPFRAPAGPPARAPAGIPPPMGAPRPGPPPLAPWPDTPQARRPEGVGAGMDRPLSDRLGAPSPQSRQRGAARPVSPRADIGQLVENIPRSMRVAVASLVEVRIARADVQALAEGLQGGGAAYQHEVTVTKAMSMRLRAPDGGFFIETASPETQWIERAMLLSADDFASWRWHVTPRQTGRRRLQLIISARTVSADGLAAETALPDQVITVRVRTNYLRSAARWVGWGLAAVVGGLLAKFGEGAFDSIGRMFLG